MLKLFDSHLGEPKGFVLPLQRWTAQAKPGWLSEIWRTRRGRTVPRPRRFSARLPAAAAIPAQSRCRPTIRICVPADPFAERRPLSDPRVTHPIRPRLATLARFAGIAAACFRRIGDAADAGRVAASRCALHCRSKSATNALCVFMPPVETLNDYLDLVATVESTAAELDLPVHLEGYAPPPDPRLNVLKVTPDPGVIEVNIQPATSWREAVEITQRCLRGRAPFAARHRQIHAGRTAHRHRRRQPRRARRT